MILNISNYDSKYVTGKPTQDKEIYPQDVKDYLGRNVLSEGMMNVHL